MLRDAGTVITLAIAAHAATPKPVAFNSIFYTAVAGIIPVLFVALTVEGGTYKDLIKSITDATKPLAIIWREVIAGLILAAGLYGELAALAALQAGRAGGWEIFPVRLSLIILVFAAGAGPAVAFFRAGVTK